MKLLLTVIALCGTLVLGACSNNETAGRGTSAGGDATTAGATASNTAQPAVAPPEPDYPQPAVVKPPRPKPGAPHGPGFDIPLIDVPPQMPTLPIDAPNDPHAFEPAPRTHWHIAGAIDAPHSEPGPM